MNVNLSFQQFFAAALYGAVRPPVQTAGINKPPLKGAAIPVK